MHPALHTCRMFLDVLRDLVGDVQSRAVMGGHLSTQRPAFAARAVARRLAAGLRLVEAYLRRVLIVLALALEPTLVQKLRPMRRPHGRKTPARQPRFVVLGGPLRVSVVSDAVPDRLELLVQRQSGGRVRAKSVSDVPMSGLYRRLDLLTAIAADPVRRARRLAFHLARSRPGRIFAPDPTLHPRRGWSTQAGTQLQCPGPRD
jgi:hypothetical protein